MTAVRAAVLSVALGCVLAAGVLSDARNRQDVAALKQAAAQAGAAAGKQPQDAAAQYRAAEAQSTLAEVELELRNKGAAKTAAEAGIRAARRAIELKPNVAEYHRMLGTLCGQVIPADLLLAFKYGGCARSSIEQAIKLDPSSSAAYLSRGVGNYYLPSAFGGGVDLAIRDFEKAIALDPKSADARLWLGIALRKAHRNAEARKEIEKSLELNPNRIWAKQQLDKTPAQ
jgi:tetratricopeptide (TPR) repeat protein